MFLTNSALRIQHKYSVTDELDNLTPFEKQIEIDLLERYVMQENERLAKQNGR